MPKKTQRLSCILLVVSLCTLLFSPVVLAQEGQSAPGSNHQFWKLIQLRESFSIKSCFQADRTTLLVPVSWKKADQRPSRPINPEMAEEQIPVPDSATDAPNIDSSGILPEKTQPTKPATQETPDTNASQPNEKASQPNEKASQPSEKVSQPEAKQSTAAVSQSDYIAEVLRLVNVERAKEFLAPLTADDRLGTAAQIRAKELNTLFSHTRPNGSSCFDVLSEQGISYRSAAENIAIGQTTPEQVVKGWMESPGHRANIMGDYTMIGIGMVSGSGEYHRGYAWVQLFTK